MINKEYVTIYDLARELDMSPSTVSRALSNHPRISEKTKKKVLEVAGKYNYRVNILASSLRKGSGNTIGIIVPRINRMFFADAIHGIESITRSRGYNLIICQSHESYAKEVENVQTLIDSRVDGILVSISAETSRAVHLESIQKNGIPLVLFDRIMEGIEASKVTNDNFTGAYETTMHLISQGYEKIAYLSGPLNLNIYKERLEGYKKALKDSRLTYREEWVYQDAITKERGMQAANHFLDAAIKPDAFFAAGDYSALGVLMILKERKISLPKDVGLAGYANEPFTEIVEPSLTTSDQKSEKIGNLAAEILLDEITGRQNTTTRTIPIKPELIIRNSTSRY